MYYCSTPLACSSALSKVVVEGPDLSRQAAPAGRVLTRRCSVRVPGQPRWGAGPGLSGSRTPLLPRDGTAEGTGRCLSFLMAAFSISLFVAVFLYKQLPA